jgi:hypothetical protein
MGKAVKRGATDGGMSWKRWVGAQITETLTVPKGTADRAAIVERHRLTERGCRVVSDMRADEGVADGGRKPDKSLVGQGQYVRGPIDLGVCLPERCLHRAGSLKRQIGETSPEGPAGCLVQDGSDERLRRLHAVADQNG